MKAELQTTFLLSETAFGHLAACYYYAYTPMQIPVGMMMDRFGPRRILTLACLFCVLGTYFFAATTNPLIAQISRFILGFGSAFAYVGVLKISDEWLPPKYFAFIAGLCSTLGMFGGISGAIVMGYFVGIMGWQVTLYYAAFIGVLLTCALVIFLRDSTPEMKQLQKHHPSHISLISGLREIIRNPQMWINGLIGCFTFLPITGFAEVWAPHYLMTLGFDKSSASFGSSSVFLGFAIGAPIWGWVSDSIKSRKRPMILGSFISALLMFWVVWMPSQTPVVMYSVLFLMGIFASVQILIFAVGNDLSPSSICATTAAFTNMLTMLGGLALPPLIGKLLDTTVLKANDVLPTAQDYSLSLTAIPIALVLAGLLSIILKETYPSPSLRAA